MWCLQSSRLKTIKATPSNFFQQIMGKIYIYLIQLLSNPRNLHPSHYLQKVICSTTSARPSFTPLTVFYCSLPFNHFLLTCNNSCQNQADIYVRLKCNAFFLLRCYSCHVSEQLLFSLLNPTLLIRFIFVSSSVLPFPLAEVEQEQLALWLLQQMKNQNCSIWAGQHMVRNEFHSRPFSPPGDFNARKIENP